MVENVSRETLDLIEKNVSRETLLLLEKYVSYLLRWNEKVNLISRQTTAEELWRDHILDSLSLSKFITKDSLVDIGSGAGFPGLVLAINGQHHATLVEINKKKASFLSYVAGELKLNVHVYSGCITKLQSVNARYIISRAMAPISEMIALSWHLMTDETEYLFHIGAKDKARELAILQKKWTFKLQEWPNPYKDNCDIVLIRDIKKR